MSCSQYSGPVFRVSPNELSFASATSWKGIYGHPIKGTSALIKSEWYEMYGSGYDSLCVGSERDPQNHARMKKSLASAFSTQALLDQEKIIQRCIDGFVDKVGHGSKRENGVNVSDWYEMIAFDILGEMAFGETFHCIESGWAHLGMGSNFMNANRMTCRETAFLDRTSDEASFLHHAA